MKSQNCNVRITIALLLFYSSMILGGCGTDWNGAEAKPTLAPTITPIMIPTTPPTIMTDESVMTNIIKDIDGNGVNDSVQIISLNDGCRTCMQIFLNENQIFEYEDPLCRMMGIDVFESLDLDGDNSNEIFITANTDANSRPYEEVLCLKQIDGKWNRMDYTKNEGGYNGFPFKITRGSSEFDFIISSDDFKQVIHYDASRYFSDDNSGNIDTIQSYRKNHYKKGDEVGFISAWGINEAKTGTYKGKNCIIALQGIEGPYGHGLGHINIYFDYNEQGKVNILTVKYLPD